MSMELLPCPMCGCDDLEGSPWPGNGDWNVQCGRPGCGVNAVAYHEDDVVKMWNTRTPSVDLAAIREVISSNRAHALSILSSEDYVQSIAENLARKNTRLADKLAKAIGDMT